MKRERCWIVQWEKSPMGMPYAVWDGSPSTAALLRWYASEGWTIHGPYVLAGDSEDEDEAA